MFWGQLDSKRRHMPVLRFIHQLLGLCQQWHFVMWLVSEHTFEWQLCQHPRCMPVVPVDRLRFNLPWAMLLLHIMQHL